MSGTGRIAEGVQFTTGECVLNWFTAHRSQAFYANVETLDAIHGHGGKTKLVWDDTVRIAGHDTGPLIGHWGESKCVNCDAVFVDPDGVWYILGNLESVPDPVCPTMAPK